MTSSTTDGTSVTRRAQILRWVRILVTLAAFAYILFRVPVRKLTAALQSLSPSAFVWALCFVTMGLLFGAVRWKWLLKAYGAPRPPRFVRLLHLYFVGFFYNTYVPGGVGGDVVRGIATREAFGNDGFEGATGGVAIVFVERVYGVSALLLISAMTFLRWPIEDVEGIGLWVSLGIAAAVTVLVILGFAPYLAPRLPMRIARVAASIPRLHRPSALVVVLLLSICVQFSSVLAGHALVQSLAHHVTLTQSAVVMPLIGASAFFPLTVGGAGVREFAFAFFYAAVGVSEPSAYAASLTYWAANLVVAGIGGLLSVAFPVNQPAKASP